MYFRQTTCRRDNRSVNAANTETSPEVLFEITPNLLGVPDVHLPSAQLASPCRRELNLRDGGNDDVRSLRCVD